MLIVDLFLKNDSKYAVVKVQKSGEKSVFNYRIYFLYFQGVVTSEKSQVNEERKGD